MLFLPHAVSHYRLTVPSINMSNTGSAVSFFTSHMLYAYFKTCHCVALFSMQGQYYHFKLHPHFFNIIMLLVESLQSCGLEKCLRILFSGWHLFSISWFAQKSLQSNGGRGNHHILISSKIHCCLCYTAPTSYPKGYHKHLDSNFKSIQLCYNELWSILLLWYDPFK